ncbi:2,3-dihydroxyphenylpropionate/2,3-dihydroxicinnamic acid 1,2-dioxygenase (plasmid) [Sphingobium sp. AntQ-1]|uniref:DODA-type extradiol aromatic ring-opening family dioxygenase n=1 Tax=Sphingobium sp. AntQ-1 TaxID=2930091 RepID=UPI00234F86DF|nr:hypothetical protein [Sphingobium sp. AntQ-1]WCP15966.1 2,3-dihydroxyphenylpropionate/2,3-dihydroxicinnamic acid 1,2-dioxygenase [Sphingobium sp. AntQ-1]
MAEILGIGISHYPPLSGSDADLANILKGRLSDPLIPADKKDPANWPALMQAEWGGDKGLAAAARHRADMLRGLRKAREAIDAFNPDFVVIFGDDQYENFRETIIPPFCIMAYEDREVRPWAQATESAMFATDDAHGKAARANIWGEPHDHALLVRGHRQGARHIASELLTRSFDVSYAYKPLHHPGLPHAFLNSILYLDYDRRGFDYPVIPFQINCYGRLVISHKGFLSAFSDTETIFDPPSPSPQRVFELGAQVARICAESEWRVAIIASSSWSHAFLTDRTWRMQPDIDLDRDLYHAMVEGNYQRWPQLTLADIEASGEHELLNWFALLGGMDALGKRCTWSDMVETYLFNSTKVTAVFE